LVLRGLAPGQWGRTMGHRWVESGPAMR